MIVCNDSLHTHMTGETAVNEKISALPSLGHVQAVTMAGHGRATSRLQIQPLKAAGPISLPCVAVVTEYVQGLDAGVVKCARGDKKEWSAASKCDMALMSSCKTEKRPCGCHGE